MQLLTRNYQHAASPEAGTDDDEALTTLRDDETEDGAPVLDEEDLKENNLTDEDAENLVWEEPEETGSAGREEKDITD